MPGSSATPLTKCNGSFGLPAPGASVAGGNQIGDVRTAAPGEPGRPFVVDVCRCGGDGRGAGHVELDGAGSTADGLGGRDDRLWLLTLGLAAVVVAAAVWSHISPERLMVPALVALGVATLLGAPVFTAC